MCIRDSGGAAPVVANMVKQSLGHKFHWAVADYLQRAARHIASKTDLEQSYAVGREAVRYAVAGKNAVMAAIKRTSKAPYRWKIEPVPLSKVANREKMMPASFISRDGFHITAACRSYLAPLIAGEAPPPYKNGLPAYARLHNFAVPKKLANSFTIK